MQKFIWFFIGVLIMLLFFAYSCTGSNPTEPTTPSSPTPTHTVFPPPAHEEEHDHGSHDHSHEHAPAVGHDSHRVIKGDTLWDIAEDHLGDPQRWHQIYKLNKDQIENPHWIFPGQVFVLN